jgi:hypothetical protein
MRAALSTLEKDRTSISGFLFHSILGGDREVYVMHVLPEVLQNDNNCMYSVAMAMAMAHTTSACFLPRL